MVNRNPNSSPAAPSKTDSIIRVVMIVPNAVLNDSRVLKSATALKDAGLSVTVLGLVGQREEMTIEQTGWSIRLIPYTNSASITRNERALLESENSSDEVAAKVGGRPENAVHRDLKYERLIIRNRRREASAEIGWLRHGSQAIRQKRSSQRQNQKAAALTKRVARDDRLKGVAGQLPSPLSRIVLRGRVVVQATYLAARSRQRLAARIAHLYHDREERAIRRELKTDEEQYARCRESLLEELAAIQDTGTSEHDSDTWRERIPRLQDFEAALGPELDKLNFDVIHVHDFPLLGVAARAKGRAQLRGRSVKLIYDAHEYTAGLRYDEPGLGAAWLSLEREYLHHADRILTVSDPIAERIKENYSLSVKPTVVLNAPVLTSSTTGVPDLRQLAGIPQGASVLVYSGNLQADRNVATVARALALMADDIHFVLVVGQLTQDADDFLGLVQALGIQDRVHLLPYVESQQVPEYLSTADLAVHPMTSDSLNHQLALPNKIFEYLHAGLPELVSDNRVMSNFVGENGIGESFSALSASDLADKATMMLKNIDRYRQAIDSRRDLLETYSWQAQIPALVGAYEELLGLDLASQATEPVTTPATPPRRSPNVLFLPVNTAGQAWAWARALREANAGVRTEVLERTRHGVAHDFESDRRFSAEEAVTQKFKLRETSNLFGMTHVIVESGQSMFGTLPARTYFDDLGLYRGAGVSVALVFHGSDIRRPSKHATLVKHSPFRVESDRTSKLEEITTRIGFEIREFDGPIFVSTPDLLDYAPNAQWLPTVIDLQAWDSSPSRLGERLPRVLMIPTNEWLKGGTFADEVCWRLDAANLIDYQRLRDLSHSQMREALGNADILIDGLTLGAYGTTAVEAMASGCLVLGNVERLTDRIEDLPIVHADPDTLETTLREIIDEPRAFRELANRGRTYAEQYHSGSYSARQLSSSIGLDRNVLGAASPRP